MSQRVCNILYQHDIFTDGYSQEIKGPNGTYGCKGRKVLLGNGMDVYVKSDGRIQSTGNSPTYIDHWELIKFQGNQCEKPKCKCRKQ
jgi:hypothetical protein